MKAMGYIMIIYFTVLLIGLLFVYSELKERNELLEENPCGYYKEHCTSWENGKATKFSEINISEDIMELMFE